MAENTPGQNPQELTEEQKAAAAKEKQARTVAAKNGSKYETPKEEEKGLFHVKLDKPQFNPKTGEKISKAYIQKFTPRSYKQFILNSKALGFTVEVLWDADAFLAEDLNAYTKKRKEAEKKAGEAAKEKAKETEQ